MEFQYSPLVWQNEGVEPSDTLKQNGFVGGYKPPASTFNKFLHSTYKCIEELQQVMISGDSDEMTFKNKPVPTTLWESDETYSEQGFLFKADIECLGVTADHSANVIFSMTEAVSGNFAPVCNTSADKVTIYAMAVPASVFTIPLIEFKKVVSGQ